MDIQGESTLSFKNSRLNAAQISEILKIDASKTICKGKPIHRNAIRISQNDIWILKEKIQSDELPFYSLKRLLEKLSSQKVWEIAQQSEEASLNLYLRSEFGQIGFKVDPEVLEMLSLFKLPLEVHILSFGLVE